MEGLTFLIKQWGILDILIKNIRKKKKSVGKTDESDLLLGTNNDQNTFHWTPDDSSMDGKHYHLS